MSEFIISGTHKRVFLLNNLELAAAIFRGPDVEGWQGIINTGLPQLLSQSSQQPAHLTETLEKLQGSLSPETPALLTELETEYVRLFVAGPGGVVAPLYESCHLGEAPRIMGDSALSMHSRLTGAGLEISLDSNEPPDHLSIELEYLYHRLATAWSDNSPETEYLAREFARCDMLPWLRRFRQTLAKGEPHHAYLHTIDLTIAVLEDLG